MDKRQLNFLKQYIDQLQALEQRIKELKARKAKLYSLYPNQATDKLKVQMNKKVDISDKYLELIELDDKIAKTQKQLLEQRCFLSDSIECIENLEGQLILREKLLFSKDNKTIQRELGLKPATFQRKQKAAFEELEKILER